MLKMFERLFWRYGTELRLKKSFVKGFFFSVNSRSWQNMERIFGPLGEIPRGQYICVLPITASVTAGDHFSVGRKSYTIRRAEEVRAKGESIYYWCLCVEKGGEDTW